MNQIKNKIYELIDLINRYTEQHEEPLVIEILGTPNAGKTTLIKRFEKILLKNNIQVTCIYESAKHCPIGDKLSPEFNDWTFSKTLQVFLEVKQNTGIVIVERGFLDAVCWFLLHKKNNRLNVREFEIKKDYLFNLVDRNNFFLHYIMKCDSDISIERERSKNFVDLEHKIVNKRIVNLYNECIDEIISQGEGSFENIKVVNTSETSIQNASIEFYQEVINLIKDKI